MKKKSSLNSILYPFFMIISVIIILIISFHIGYSSTKKNNSNNSLSSNHISNSIIKNSVSNEIISTENSQEFDEILLDGMYGFENADVLYDFSKDGTVSISGNVTEEIGTYKTISKNKIELVLTEYILYDIETGGSSTSKINRTEKLTYDNENTLITSDNNKLIKLKDNL